MYIVYVFVHGARRRRCFYFFFVAKTFYTVKSYSGEAYMLLYSHVRKPKVFRSYRKFCLAQVLSHSRRK